MVDKGVQSVKEEKTMREKLDAIELPEPDFENVEKYLEAFEIEKKKFATFLRKSTHLSDDALNRHFTI